MILNISLYVILIGKKKTLKYFERGARCVFSFLFIYLFYLIYHKLHPRPMCTKRRFPGFRGCLVVCLSIVMSFATHALTHIL